MMLFWRNFSLVVFSLMTSILLFTFLVFSPRAYPPNPFAGYLRMGASVEIMKQDGFTCSYAGMYVGVYDFILQCFRQNWGSFNSIAAYGHQNVISWMSFHPRAMRIGDIVQWYGAPVKHRYRYFVWLKWDSGRDYSTLLTHRPYSLFTPVEYIQFAY